MRSSSGLRTRRRVGTAMIAASLALGTWSAGLGAAVAQEEPQAPEEMEQAETERAAYYQAPAERILPSTLVSEFPPGVVCIVQPDLCPESLEPVTTPVEDGLGAVQEGEAAAEPEAAPLPPDSLPVSATGGQPDYRSAIQFTLPTVPEGQQVDSFKVYLTQTDPSYSGSSPAFRQAVLAALTCARTCDEDQFQKITETSPAEEKPLDVEVCPIASGAEWQEGDAQKDAKLPEADCLFGANGTRIDGETVLWEFDLTFALQGLTEGQFQYNGFLIRPANLPNLAFGDPDTSFNKQVVFTREVGYTLETSEAPAPVATLDLGDSSGGFSSAGGSGGGFSSAPSGGSSSSDVFAAPGGQTSDEAAAAPEVAAPATGEAAPPAPAAGTAQDTTLAAGEAPAPASAWWVWGLVPMFLGGMYLVSQSLMAAPVLADPERAGAMTRLIEKRRQAAGGVAGPELVQF